MTDKNLEKIKMQIELLKKRIHNMDETLSTQEQAIDLIDERAKNLLTEAQLDNPDMSVEGIMKKAFHGSKIPKILLK